MQTIKENIKIHAENCAQCLSCMLICSFIHSKSFNPSKAHIKIFPGHFSEKTWISTEIIFLESCKPSCWLCTQECAYDALEYTGDHV
ncbi:MAG TPA: hypothetical protein VMV49_13035 [Candidatus Deferrimicrobium sp.]|nr:hypothetical protein [Candidatus Deferrimicrobium sp.]